MIYSSLLALTGGLAYIIMYLELHYIYPDRRTHPPSEKMSFEVDYAHL